MFARSTVMGNAKASTSGTSYSMALTLFYCLFQFLTAKESQTALFVIYKLLWKKESTWGEDAHGQKTL